MLQPGDIVGAKVHPDGTINYATSARVLSEEEIFQKENRTPPTSEEWQKQEDAQSRQARMLQKKIILNDGVHPETSERRIYGAAQFVMDTLDDPDSYRTLSGLRFDNNYAFGLYTYGFNTLPGGILSGIVALQGKNDSYKKLLGIIQNETQKVFIKNDEGVYTRSNEEFRITKFRKGLQEVNQHRSDSEFNEKYNDRMYSILYLLNESFSNEYHSKYGNYYRTDDQKKEGEKMKERAKNIKVS